MTLQKYFLYVALVLSLPVFLLFQVKYTVLDLENEHKKLREQIRKTQEELHVLNAEWTYLNDPERLFQLAQKHLNLQPLRGNQIRKYSEIENSGLGVYDRQELEKLLAQQKKSAKKQEAQKVQNKKETQTKKVAAQTLPAQTLSKVSKGGRS